jgi:hypothetical protein
VYQLEFFNVFNIEQQIPIQESILPHHRLRSVRHISASVEVLMSNSQQRLASATAMRLAAITDMEANLKAQLSELNRLRDQLRKAQLSVPEDRGACPTEQAA